MTHTLDQALLRATGYVALLDEPKSKTLGRLMSAAGNAILYEDHSKIDHLVMTVKVAKTMWLFASIGYAAASADPYETQLPMHDEFDALVRAEYDRADTKHQGMTPHNPGMSDDDRAAILGEEVGEVARALTPDADTAVGHGGELAEELVQTATMAAAWLARILEDREEAHR